MAETREMNGTIETGGGEMVERQGGPSPPPTIPSAAVRSEEACVSGSVQGWGAPDEGSLLGGMTVRGRQWL